MLDCLIIGDSLAVGMAEATTRCVSIAKTGITSSNWLKTYRSSLRPAKKIVISLGTNDRQSSDLYRILVELRRQVQASSVIWVLPSEELKPWARYYVTYAAYTHGDYVLDIPSVYLGQDKIHLSRTGYKGLTDGALNSSGN